MRFNSRHNGEVITIEYDDAEASGDDGLVYECEIFYEGHSVTALVGDYESFLMECEQHFEATSKHQMIGINGLLISPNLAAQFNQTYR